MPAATAQQILSRLARLLKVAESDMGDYWTDITAQAAIFADQEVKGRLLARGFRLVEDISLWDRLGEFTLDLGLWRSIMLGGVYSGFDVNVIKALDRREELAGVLVFVDGVWSKPASGQPGTVVTAGPREADADGVFNWDPEGDPIDLGFRW